jgi:hypothetical protein
MMTILQLQLQVSCSFYQVPINATSTSTRLMIYNDSHQTSLNDVTTVHVSTITATMTATMTQVSTTRSATTKAPQLKLNKCRATEAQHKTMSPSILNPANMMAYHAIPRSLFLLCIKDSSEITAPHLLLFKVEDAHAIMVTTHVNPMLQLIVVSMGTFCPKHTSIP